MVKHIALILLTKGRGYLKSSLIVHRERKKKEKGIWFIRLICFWCFLPSLVLGVRESRQAQFYPPVTLIYGKPIFISSFMFSASRYFLREKKNNPKESDNENPQEQDRQTWKKIREFILLEYSCCCWLGPCQRSPITAVFRNIPTKGLALVI